MHGMYITLLLHDVLLCMCFTDTDSRLENGQYSLMENSKDWSKGEYLTNNYVILL